MPFPRPEATPPVTKMNFGCFFTRDSMLADGNDATRELRADIDGRRRYSPLSAGVGAPCFAFGAGTRPSESNQRSGPEPSMMRLTVIVSASALAPTARTAATTIQASESTTQSPRPISKPRRFAPASPSIARSRRSGASRNAPAMTVAGTAGARAQPPEPRAPGITSGAPRSRNHFSDRPGATSRPFQRFAHAAIAITPAVPAQNGRAGSAATAATAAPPITRTLTTPLETSRRASARRCCRMPRGPPSTRSSMRPAAKTNREAPSTIQAGRPASNATAAVIVPARAARISGTPRMRGTEAPRWFAIASRPQFIGRHRATAGASSWGGRREGCRGPAGLDAGSRGRSVRSAGGGGPPGSPRSGARPGPRRSSSRSRARTPARTGGTRRERPSSRRVGPRAAPRSRTRKGAGSRSGSPASPARNRLPAEEARRSRDPPGRRRPPGGGPRVPPRWSRDRRRRGSRCRPISGGAHPRRRGPSRAGGSTTAPVPRRPRQPPPFRRASRPRPRRPRRPRGARAARARCRRSGPPRRARERPRPFAERSSGRGRRRCRDQAAPVAAVVPAAGRRRVQQLVEPEHEGCSADLAVEIVDRDELLWVHASVVAEERHERIGAVRRLPRRDRHRADELLDERDHERLRLQVELRGASGDRDNSVSRLSDRAERRGGDVAIPDEPLGDKLPDEISVAAGARRNRAQAPREVDRQLPLQRRNRRIRPRSDDLREGLHCLRVRERHPRGHGEDADHVRAGRLERGFRAIERVPVASLVGEENDVRSRKLVGHDVRNELVDLTFQLRRLRLR